MEMRSKLLAVLVIGLFAAALFGVAHAMRIAADRAEQELARSLPMPLATAPRETVSRASGNAARPDSFFNPEADSMRAQVERLSARLARLSDLLDKKSSDYDDLKADFERSTELLNELLTAGQAAVSTISEAKAAADEEPAKTAEQMLAEATEELRELRAELADLEKEAALDELHIFDLEDRKQGLEAVAASALVRSGSAAAAALADLLADRRAEIRRWAATVLGQIGPDAHAAADALHDALSDPDEDVRIAARKALRRIENP